MNDVSIHQFLVLYTWFPLAAFLLFFLLIARFYQKFSGDQTYYWLYLVAIVLFGAMAVRAASIKVFVDDGLMNVLSFMAGGLLLFLTLRLYYYMMTNRDS